MNAMKSIFTLILMSLIIPLTLQHRNKLNNIDDDDDDHAISQKRTKEEKQQQLQQQRYHENVDHQSDQELLLLPTSDNSLHIEDHNKKPTLKFYQIDKTEFYRHLNATINAAKSLNLSSLNSSLDHGDEMHCAPGQSSIIYLLTIILYSLVCIVGLFGNTLVIYVVLRFSKMQTVTNIYILNLAIADECFLIGIPFLLYTMRIGGWQFGEYACKAYMVSTSITQFTSSIFLLIMSADRYIAVCHPISSPRYRTPMVSKMVSAIAWLTSVLLMLPVILFANAVTADDHTTCNIEWPESQNTQSGTTFILYSLVLGFATPLTFILGFYCLVIRKLHTVGPKNKSKEKKRSHRKVTKLVLTVITVYIMCWLPYWISQVALITSSDHCMSRLEITIFLLVSCLGYSNSAMNPVLYAFLSDNFKKSFMKACTCSAQKDINAQLQLENSMFPRFSKSRATEKMLPSNKAKQRKSILSKGGKPRFMSSTATTTTATTTCTNMTSIDANHSVVPLEGKQLNNHLLALPPIIGPAASSFGSVNSNNLLLMPGNASIGTDNSMLENSIDGSESLGKPPVLHTDL